MAVDGVVVVAVAVGADVGMVRGRPRRPRREGCPGVGVEEFFSVPVFLVGAIAGSMVLLCSRNDCFFYRLPELRV